MKFKFKSGTYFAQTSGCHWAKYKAQSVIGRYTFVKLDKDPVKGESITLHSKKHKDYVQLYIIY